tara:strand:+ start:42 stop:320 length:279 start_codon:yes stop_codon:yes gene_type:complete
MTQLKPCPFCGDPMEWRKGGYAAHTDPSVYCPIATEGFVSTTLWNTRIDTAYEESCEQIETLRAEVTALTFLNINQNNLIDSLYIDLAGESI